MPGHTQKEKNKRRNKRNKSRRKAESRQSNVESLGAQLRQTTQPTQPRRRMSHRSMRAPRGLVANAYSRRMPIGSNHLRGPSGVHGLPTNERERPLKPVVLQPIGLAQSIGSLNNTFKRLPAASIPRGQRFLREAVAVPVPIRPVIAVSKPDEGRMYGQMRRLRPTVTRRAWVSELNKESAAASRNAAAGQRYRGMVWAPSVLRENLVELTQQEKDRLTELGKQHLIPGPEIAGYDRYNTIQRARHVLEHPNHDEHYNSNWSSGSNSHSPQSNHSYVFNSESEPDTGYAQIVRPGNTTTYNPPEVVSLRGILPNMSNNSYNSNDERVHDLFTLTEEEMERLRGYGEEGIVLLDYATMPGERFSTMSQVSRARDFLRKQRKRERRAIAAQVSARTAILREPVYRPPTSNESNWETNESNESGSESNGWSNTNNS
jgi:hypothetical protein